MTIDKRNLIERGAKARLQELHNEEKEILDLLAQVRKDATPEPKPEMKARGWTKARREAQSKRLKAYHAKK